MRNYLRRMLTDAVVEGFDLMCHYENHIDYQGTNTDEAYKALTACDEMGLTLVKDGTVHGYALICNDLEPDEQIADCGADDWVDQWTKRNIP